MSLCILLFTERKDNSVTIMLVAIVCNFLAFTSLAFINNIIEILQNFQIINETFNSTYTVLVEISNLMVDINSASTIIIYLVFGSKYRSIFIAKLHYLQYLLTMNDDMSAHKYNASRQPSIIKQTTNRCGSHMRGASATIELISNNSNIRKKSSRLSEISFARTNNDNETMRKPSTIEDNNNRLLVE